jgi:threonine/homoserine/homoserine lactone efflux protein
VSLELYLAFVLATVVLMLTPGPNMALTVANSLAHGPRRALLTVAGASSGLVVHLVIVTIGLGWLTALLADWLEVLRWVGVAYLLWLGWMEWRARPVLLDPAAVPRAPAFRLWAQGFLVCLTNPKVLLFCAAFFPQFVVRGGSLLLQMTVLGATFIAIGFACDSTCAALAGRMRRGLADLRRVRLRHRITGTLLIGTGVGLALARRA